MNTILSLHRIKVLLLVDWIENKKNFIFEMIVLLLACFCLLLLVQMNKNSTQWLMIVYGIGSISTLFLFCKHVSRKIYRSEHLFLSTPANTLEKYLVFLIEYFIYFLGLQLAFRGGLFLRSLFSYEESTIGFLQLLIRIYSLKELVLSSFFISSLFFLSSIMFKKNAILKALAAIFTFQIILFGAIIVQTHDIRINKFNLSTPIYRTIDFLMTISGPVIIISMIIVLYIGYLKIKEKELR